MRVRIGVVAFIPLFTLHLLGHAQTELVLPLDPNFMASSGNPAALAQEETGVSGLAFRNQLHFHNGKRSYLGNTLAWNMPAGTQAVSRSSWGVEAYSGIEPGLRRLKMNALYAYTTPLTTVTFLRLGLSLGFDQRRYGNDYLFPDEIYGTPQNTYFASKLSGSIGMGMEVQWQAWTLSASLQQLGNTMYRPRASMGLGYGKKIHSAAIQARINASLSYYHLDNHDLFRLSTGIMGQKFGSQIAQTIGLKKSESLSSIGLIYCVNRIHFQYDIGWSYYRSSTLGSSGIRNEFGLRYTFSN